MMIATSFYRSTFFMVTAAAMMICLVAPTTSASMVMPTTTTTPQLKGRALKERGNKNNRSSSSSSNSDTQRVVVEARATLVNLDLDELTPEQVAFFETTFINVFNELQASRDSEDNENESNGRGNDGNSNGNGNGNGNGLRLRSLIVEDAVKGGDKGRGRNDGSGYRRLRGADATTPASTSTDTAHAANEDRSLSAYTPGFYFDIWALLELAGRCTYCGGGFDDDDDDLFNRRELSMADDVAHRLLESMLLDQLRSGPFAEFANVADCSIVYMT